MKQVYGHLQFKTGVHVAGICTVKIVPKEWVVLLLQDILTGKVTQMQLLTGKDFLSLDLVADSYDYEEKPKSNKSGPFFEVSAGGTLNSLDPESQQILESLKHHEFVCLLKDRQGKQKLVGNQLYGARLQMGYKQGNSRGGTEVLTLDLVMECEDRPPFLAP